ncbi:uncharacterized protein LOC119336752 [Triticum dicoccoides]|nr:uncharacterized protein LOC119336752 [Triticum dicoccoides]
MEIHSVSRFSKCYVTKKSISVHNAPMLPSAKPSPSKEKMIHPSTKSIKSAIINGPKDSNNITPPSCQPAAIVIEKKQNMYSLDKRSIQLTEGETTNKDIIVQSGQARET